MSARLVRDDPAGLVAALGVLRSGGVVGLPTDTVYGIATSLHAPGGIERLFAVKDRPPERAITVLVDSLDRLDDVVAIPAAARVLAAACWPGALTIVLGLLPGASLPAALTAGTATLGVRVPDHPTPRAIARAIGPLPTTSANRHGEPPALDASVLMTALGERLDLVVDGGPARGGTASTVVDCSTGPARLLRAGALTAATLASILDDAEIPHALGADRAD